MKKLALVAVLAASVAPLSAAKFDGGYVGASVAWGVMQGKTNNKDVFSATRGVLGGAHLGWDKVFSGKWLLGAEGSVDFSGQKYVKESFALAGKMGYVIDNVSVGAIVGWKNTKIEDKRLSVFNGNNLNDRVNGVTAGGYMATMVTDNIELAGQYTHDFYKKKKNAKISQDAFRLKLSYKM